VAEIQDSHVHHLVNTLQLKFYISREMILEAIQRKSSFHLIHLETMLKIDVFILSDDDDVSQQKMSRREKHQVSDDPPQELFVASAEDIILHKLYWFQLGGEVSEKQWSDVLGVLQVQSDTLDYFYVHKYAQKRWCVNPSETRHRGGQYRGKI